jgi:hypothetical protein
VARTGDVLRDGCLRHVDAKFQQLSVDPRRTPEWVGFRHRSNQRAYVGRHRRSPDTSATFPRPEQAEALTMPGDDGFRLDDDQCGSPSGPPPRQPHPQPPFRRHEPQPSRSRPIEHLQLVPQGEHLKRQCGARLKGTSDRAEQRDQDDNSRRAVQNVSGNSSDFRHVHRRSRHRRRPPSGRLLPRPARERRRAGGVHDRPHRPLPLSQPVRRANGWARS